MSEESAARDAEKAEEEKLKKKYGALPTQKGLLERRLKGGDKKYFDSADWAKDKDKGATPDIKTSRALHGGVMDTCGNYRQVA
mmetsp:Transcript_29230/g.61460  ORF Transcript_29230/g.61460 Transcript_29230/m.61460 type:complete len:83 (-) Transcript_29230:766-1014(-)